MGGVTGRGTNWFARGNVKKTGETHRPGAPLSRARPMKAARPLDAPAARNLARRLSPVLPRWPAAANATCTMVREWQMSGAGVI